MVSGNSSLTYNPFAGDLSTINKNKNIYHNKKGRGAALAKLFSKTNLMGRNSSRIMLDDDGSALIALEAEIKLHKVLKDLCIESDKHRPEPQLNKNTKDWVHLKKFDKDNEENNFSARIYRNRNEIAIIYRVNKNYDDIEEISNDIIRGKEPPQSEDAEMVYKTVSEAFPRNKIILSGHSIGGTLAQDTAYKHKEARGVTFNALGIASLYQNLEEPEYVENIVNYVTSKESKLLRVRHIGELRMIYFNEYTEFLQADFGGLVISKPVDKDRHVLNDFDRLEFFKVTFAGAA